jgi:hypothetical protein
VRAHGRRVGGDRLPVGRLGLREAAGVEVRVALVEAALGLRQDRRELEGPGGGGGVDKADRKNRPQRPLRPPGPPRRPGRPGPASDGAGGISRNESARAASNIS